VLIGAQKRSVLGCVTTKDVSATVAPATVPATAACGRKGKPKDGLRRSASAFKRDAMLVFREVLEVAMLKQ